MQIEVPSSEVTGRFAMLNREVLLQHHKLHSYRNRTLEVCNTYFEYLVKQGMARSKESEELIRDSGELRIEYLTPFGILFCWNTVDRWLRSTDNRERPVDENRLKKWHHEIDGYCSDNPAILGDVEAMFVSDR